MFHRLWTTYLLHIYLYQAHKLSPLKVLSLFALSIFQITIINSSCLKRKEGMKTTSLEYILLFYILKILLKIKNILEI